MSAAEDEKKLKKQETECVSCLCNIDADHCWVRCVQSHSLCQECSEMYMTTCVTDGALPARCCLCKVELNEQVAQRNVPAALQDVWSVRARRGAPTPPHFALGGDD